ncbi:MAG: pyridoxal-phosphate dependent enzyme [Aeromicrobium sp.]|jgi:D-cysteine desulfhydrase|nr:pyridoxal-phosphate dependent enzyme [Aeromicrobium sp.]
MKILSGPSAHPLFSRCPALRDGMPHVPLGTFPTPVQRLDALERELDIGELWVKRDDLSGTLYGGNKVRKLEFTLADALRSGAREVVTFGGLGSNHALATTVYARHLRLGVTLFLTPQPVTGHVRRTLLLYHHFGAEVRLARDADDALERARALCDEREAATGRAPYVVPYGGTTPLATAGMIDAGMELAMQAVHGECPVPDCVYVAMGSMGTAAGITLGLSVAEFPTEVRAVQVTPESVASAGRLGDLIEATADAMCAFDPGCGCTVSVSTNVRVVDRYVADGYGTPTPESRRAMELGASAGLVLDETYTAKTLAAIIADAEAGMLSEARVVFWDTFDSHDFSAVAVGIDHRALPGEFHPFFEGDPVTGTRD